MLQSNTITPAPLLLNSANLYYQHFQRCAYCNPEECKIKIVDTSSINWIDETEEFIGNNKVPVKNVNSVARQDVLYDTISEFQHSICNLTIEDQIQQHEKQLNLVSDLLSDHYPPRCEDFKDDPREFVNELYRTDKVAYCIAKKFITKLAAAGKNITCFEFTRKIITKFQRYFNYKESLEKKLALLKQIKPEPVPRQISTIYRVVAQLFDADSENIQLLSFRLKGYTGRINLNRHDAQFFKKLELYVSANSSSKILNHIERLKNDIKYDYPELNTEAANMLLEENRDFIKRSMGIQKTTKRDGPCIRTLTRHAWDQLNYGNKTILNPDERGLIFIKAKRIDDRFDDKKGSRDYKNMNCEITKIINKNRNHFAQHPIKNHSLPVVS
jgi:hypothetical protein